MRDIWQRTCESRNRSFSGARQQVGFHPVNTKANIVLHHREEKVRLQQTSRDSCQNKVFISVYRTICRAHDDMSDSTDPSLLTLPIESVYRILEHLHPVDIILSVRAVCSRLNAITDSYQPYQVRVLFRFDPRFDTTYQTYTEIRLPWYRFKHFSINQIATALAHCQVRRDYTSRFSRSSK